MVHSSAVKVYNPESSDVFYFRKTSNTDLRNVQTIHRPIQSDQGDSMRGAPLPKKLVFCFDKQKLERGDKMV